MRPVAWMVVASVASWLATMVVVGTAIGVDVLLGMIGPLAIVTTTSALMERTYRENPDRLTALMISAFAGKMVFFGAYVAAMLRLPFLRPIPFVASFTSYFIALYLMEALCLRRLFVNSTPASH